MHFAPSGDKHRDHVDFFNVSAEFEEKPWKIESVNSNLETQLLVHQLHLPHHGASFQVDELPNHDLRSMVELLHLMVDTPEPRSSDSLTSAFGFMVSD